MVFGGVTRTSRSSSTKTPSGPADARIRRRRALTSRCPEIRRLLFDGQYAEAEALVRSKLLVGRGEGNSYQTLGDLFLTADLKGEPTDYRRSLDLDTGVAVTTFTLDGVTYRREIFASAPDQVIVVRFMADRAGKISLGVELQRPDVQIESSGNDTLIMSRPVSSDPEQRCEICRRAQGGNSRNGQVRAEGNHLTVSNANAVTLFLAADSNYNHKNPLAPLTNDFRAQALEQVKAASARSYAKGQKERSTADHQALFRRVDLQLSSTPAPDQPTDERLAAVQKGAGRGGLVALHFQFCRYLLIFRRGPAVPSNLQGISNKA